ncbi:MAG: MBL fold metallo-hydrolase, partial [Limnohabitans sp.]
HADHVEGFASVLARFAVGLLLVPGCPDDVATAAGLDRVFADEGLRPVAARAGMVFAVADLRLEVFDVPHTSHERSYGARFESGGRPLVYSGDTAWPDDLLWTGAITLSGPLSQAEVPSLLEQELALALPVPIDQVAWDARPLAQPGDRPSDRGAWQTLWSWLRGRLGPAMGHQLASSGHSHQDAVWQCWAIPRALAHHIGAVGRQLGWASVGIEPRSVSVQRATALWPPQADPLNAEVSIQGAPSPEALAAWGAAYRPPQQAPDLLRGHRGGWLLRGSLKARGWWPGLLAWGLAAGAGYALGGVVHERWAREHEAWAQRLRQLQAIEQARQANRQARDQARWQHQAHQAQVTYNQRFAQVLQGWASTVPEGVRWQQFSLRPRVIELQGHALDAESFTRWMDQWPQALPAGGQHQVHWQPEAPSVQPAQVPSVLGVRVQVSWNAPQKVTE